MHYAVYWIHLLDQFLVKPKTLISGMKSTVSAGWSSSQSPCSTSRTTPSGSATPQSPRSALTTSTRTSTPTSTSSAPSPSMSASLCASSPPMSWMRSDSKLVALTSMTQSFLSICYFPNNRDVCWNGANFCGWWNPSVEHSSRPQPAHVPSGLDSPSLS